MRVFLILLLLANLGYLAWRQGWVFEGPEAPPADQSGTFQPAGQSLTLLAELSQERLTLMDSLAQARTARTDAATELQQVQGEIAAVASEIGENQAELAQNRVRSTEVQQALLDTLDAAVAEAQAPGEVPGIVANQAPTVPWCARAGSFVDRPAAEAFIDSLETLRVRGQIEAQEQPVSSTWWVHMPAFASEALARERLLELQAKNIDSYYMRSGEMAGGISLGVYSREESALIAQQQLAERGYPTSIREVVRMGERLYVRIVMPDATLREAPEWTDFLARTGGLEVLENACETIAPGNEFP
jgi:hypothetical protein